jgi:hypothetical protein
MFKSNNYFGAGSYKLILKVGSVKLITNTGGVKLISGFGNFRLISSISSKISMCDVPLSSIQKEVLTGLLLSDGMLTKRNKGIKGKASFSLTQTCNPNHLYVLGHVELLFYTFNLFQNYINSPIPMSNWARTYYIKGYKGDYFLYDNRETTSAAHLPVIKIME